MKQKEKSYIIDWEYVGVGGVRGVELKNDLSGSNLILGTSHLSSAWKSEYLSALWDFVEDHQPQEIFYTTDVSPEILLFLRREKRDLKSLGQSIQVSLYKVMERIFRQTFEMLNLQDFERQKLLDHYFLEISSSSWLISERARWFPAYLKTNQYHDAVVQRAQFEWAYEMLQFYDFFKALSSDSNHVKINPSVQILKKENDLVALYLNEAQNQVIVLKLEPSMALVLDLLSEERKFSVDQIVDMLMLEKNSHLLNLDRESCYGLVKNLIKAQLIY